MFNVENIARVATAAVGALVLSTTVVGAAVGPARVIETAPLAQLAPSDIRDQAHA